MKEKLILTAKNKKFLLYIVLTSNPPDNINITSFMKMLNDFFCFSCYFFKTFTPILFFFCFEKQKQRFPPRFLFECHLKQIYCTVIAPNHSMVLKKRDFLLFFFFLLFLYLRVKKNFFFNNFFPTTLLSFFCFHHLFLTHAFLV